MIHTEHSGRIARALSGQSIYGDDFTADELRAWYADEESGYATLEHEDSQNETYLYRGLDTTYFLPHLRGRKLDALGVGSAFGLEFELIREELRSLTVIEPAERYWRPEVAGQRVDWIKPKPEGDLDLADGRFDLIFCLGVLHHVPNVSHLVKELHRVARSGCVLCIREPITSMGDWRLQRPGLTRRERGLPWEVFGNALQTAGFGIRSRRMIGFGPLLKAASALGVRAPWNQAPFVRLDAWLSAAFAFNYSYHRTSLPRRFAPSVGIWTCVKN